MHYADTSFLISLVTSDAGTERVRAAFWKMGRPELVFCAIHEMEVRNTLRAIQFIDSKNAQAKMQPLIAAQRLRAEARLNHMLLGGALKKVIADWNSVLAQFETLSSAHSRKMGTRTLDILHVAFALQLHCKHFLTCDVRQAALAKAAGLKAWLVEIDE